MANTILLFFHILKFLLKLRPKPTDLTVGQLALTHLVMLLTVGAMAADTFGSQGWGDDVTCKVVVYVYRLMRGLSLCATCLLSVLQAITLSPTGSCLAKFKRKSSHPNSCCLLFLWAFNVIISGRFLIAITATPNVTSDSLVFVTESCSLEHISYLFRYICFSLVNIHDVSLLALMAMSSGYMVSLLCKHTRQSQYLHSTSPSPKSPPETRATRTILLLMSFFLVMYFLDTVVSASSGILWNNGPTYHCVQMLVGNGYAAVSPLVLMSTEKRMLKYLTFMRKKDNKCLFTK
ncbi:vomeronasal type-1 receptor 90-like [Ctenodactylus gundi]